MSWFGHDTRHALRSLRRSPGFAASAVLTLALGIGASSAMFTVVDQLMLRPYPYMREPASVRRVYLRMPGSLHLNPRESFPYARYLDLRNWTTSFAQAAAFSQVDAAIGTGDDVREWPIMPVSASFFGFFDARPALGRFFTAAEDVVPEGAHVAVLGYGYWQSELGGRNVIGETMLVQDIPCVIIGVAPRGFIGVSDGSPPALFLPITTWGANQPGGSSQEYWSHYQWDWTEMLVRLKPGIPVARANSDLTLAYIRSRDAARAIHTWMPRTDPVRPLATVGAVRTAAGPHPGLASRTVQWVAGVAVIVLLVACANVTNLILTRTMRRRREMALRLALGVSRTRLAMQFLTESVVIVTLGAITGVVAAQWGGAFLRRFYLPPGSATSVLDGRMLFVLLATIALAASGTALAPTLLGLRTDLVSGLKSGVREGTHQRSTVRGVLLVAQAALSVALLVGAGLFVRSLDNLRRLRLGYDVDPMLMVQWHPRGETLTVEEQVALRARVLAAAQAIPGVERAAWANNIPLQGTSTTSLFVPGIDSVARLGRFTYQMAGSDYFETIGTHILRGRGFTEADRAGTPLVTVVSASMARVLWPGRDPLGQCLRVGADTAPCTTVVGVAEDAVHDPLADQPLRYYRPVGQADEAYTRLLLLRMRTSPASSAEAVRRVLQADMPGTQYLTAQPMSILLDDEWRSWRLGATLFTAFGGLALLVAAVGLYGVIAYSVTQRRHEIAVRVALGAQPGGVVRLVTVGGIRFALLGVLIGSAIALGASRWIEPLLFGESAKDPTVYVVVGAALLVTALLASAVPAVRASRADPNSVLRAE